MILYALICETSHRFDSWFRDSAAYEHQVAAGLIACPICQSAQVTKSIMAPALHGRRSEGTVAADASLDRGSDGSPSYDALLDDGRRQIRDRLKAIRDTILAEGQDVGARFPEEARRMNDGDVPTRPIYGHATPTEARALLEDGIMILPVPAPAEGLN